MRLWRAYPGELEDVVEQDFRPHGCRHLDRVGEVYRMSNQPHPIPEPGHMGPERPRRRQLLDPGGIQDRPAPRDFHEGSNLVPALGDTFQSIGPYDIGT